MWLNIYSSILSHHSSCVDLIHPGCLSRADIRDSVARQRHSPATVRPWVNMRAVSSYGWSLLTHDFEAIHRQIIYLVIESDVNLLLRLFAASFCFSLALLECSCFRCGCMCFIFDTIWVSNANPDQTFKNSLQSQVCHMHDCVHTRAPCVIDVSHRNTTTATKLTSILIRVYSTPGKWWRCVFDRFT